MSSSIVGQKFDFKYVAVLLFKQVGLNLMTEIPARGFTNMVYSLLL